MKKASVLFLFVFLFLKSPAWSTPFVIIANAMGHNIHIVDFGLNPPKIYGPFLTGQLGTPQDSLLDVAVTPDSNYALISNFMGHEIYRVDISDPTSPVLAGKLSVPQMLPEDIAISPDGKFAVCTDGYDSSGNGASVIFIPLQNFGNFSVYTLTTPGAWAQAVAVAGNGTIVICNSELNRIIYGKVNSTFTGLVSENVLATIQKPQNVAIAPDGATVLVADSWSGRIFPYLITGPGTMVEGSSSWVPVRGYPQSIDFSPDGKKAYVVSSIDNPDKISWLNITSPGNISLGASPAASLLSNSTYVYYGVDVLAVLPDGKRAVTTCDDLEQYFDLQVVDLTTFQVTTVPTNGYNPAGVAVFGGMVLPPTNLSLTRLTNNYIFYKEYINKVSWEANQKGAYLAVKFRLYRKAKGAADSAYELLGEFDVGTTQYVDRNLGRNDLFTYGVVAVDSRGSVSQLVEISN